MSKERFIIEVEAMADDMAAVDRLAVWLKRGKSTFKLKCIDIQQTGEPMRMTYGDGTSSTYYDSGKPVNAGPLAEVSRGDPERNAGDNFGAESQCHSESQRQWGRGVLGSSRPRRVGCG